MAFFIRHSSVWLKGMRMTADHNVNTLLHKEGCPFFFVFSRHWFHFFAPVSDKDQYIAVFFGFLDHGSYFVFFKDVDHVFFAFAGTGIVGTICIIKERNLNTVYLQHFDGICIFFCLMDSENRYIRMAGFPVIQCLCHIVISVVIDMIGCRLDYIESCIDQCITNFRRSCKGWITTDSIMVCCKDGFLVYHGNIGSLDLIFDIFVNFVIVPCTGVGFAGFNQ